MTKKKILNLLQRLFNTRPYFKRVVSEEEKQHYIDEFIRHPEWFPDLNKEDIVSVNVKVEMLKIIEEDYMRWEHFKEKSEKEKEQSILWSMLDPVHFTLRHKVNRRVFVDYNDEEKMLDVMESWLKTRPSLMKMSKEEKREFIEGYIGFTEWFPELNEGVIVVYHNEEEIVNMLEKWVYKDNPKYMKMSKEEKQKNIEFSLRHPHHWSRIIPKKKEVDSDYDEEEEDGRLYKHDEQQSLMKISNDEDDWRRKLGNKYEVDWQGCKWCEILKDRRLFLRRWRDELKELWDTISPMLCWFLFIILYILIQIISLFRKRK
jgi:hypothetical protein